MIKILKMKVKIGKIQLISFQFRLKLKIKLKVAFNFIKLQSIKHFYSKICQIWLRKFQLFVRFSSHEAPGGGGAAEIKA